MWPELIQRWIDRMRGVPAGNLPPLNSYTDTLKYLASGMPTVVHTRLEDGLYGTYDPRVPSHGRMQDTITIDNGHQSVPIPEDFTLAHEMGHKVYWNNQNGQTIVPPSGPGYPELRKMLGWMRFEDHGSAATIPSEQFAQAFGQGLQQVRGQPYTPPTETHPAAPIYVDQMADWIKRRLSEYDRRW